MTVEHVPLPVATHAPFHILWNDTSLSRKITEMGFLSAQLNGHERYVRETQVHERVLVTEQILPVDSEVMSWCEDRQGLVVHARHPLGSVLIERSGNNATIALSASTPERLEQLHHALVRQLPDRSDAEGVPVSVWMSTSFGLTTRRRTVPASSWTTIRENYATEVRNRLDQLMAVRQPTTGGRLIVWYGEPGTGKTNAIRALAHSWSSWCDTHILADPEAFFGSSKAIDQVLADGQLLGDAATRLARAEAAPNWRLIVAEDTDELLLATKNARGGGAMARLFNMADGILGQGSNAIVLITTNTPVRELHPALLRPGRCLSRIEFERFSADEARSWLPPDLAKYVDGPTTLAELYELRGDHQRIQHHHIETPKGYL